MLMVERLPDPTLDDCIESRQIDTEPGIRIGCAGDHYLERVVVTVTMRVRARSNV